MTKWIIFTVILVFQVCVFSLTVYKIINSEQSKNIQYAEIAIAMLVLFGLIATTTYKKVTPSLANAVDEDKTAEAPENKDIFKISVITLMKLKYPGPLLYLYDSKLGKTISPISVALFVEVVNNKSIISRISNYQVRALLRYDEGGVLNTTQDPNGGISYKYKPSGNIVEKWHTLHSVGFLHTQVYWANNGSLKKCYQMDFRKNGFDSLARTKQLDPGESLMGWIFFELETEISVQGPETKQLEFTFKNSADETQTFQIVPPKAQQDWSSISGGTWTPFKGYHDLTEQPVTICTKIDLYKRLKGESNK